jgi:oxygen-independent coproporphyrinogen-3 oxidase
MRKMGYTTDNLCWFVKNSSDACDHFRFRWNDNSYVGIGQSAYGYINGVAYQNTKKIISYRNFLKNNSLPITKGKVTTEEERATRAAILGLKTNAGVCLRDIEKRYEVQLKPKVEKQLKQLVKLNVFSIDDDRLSFTEKGLFWGDCVLSSFMDEPMFYLSRRRRP